MLWFKRKRSQWFEGLLCAEKLFQARGHPELKDFLWSISDEYDQFANGACDYKNHIKYLERKGLLNVQ